MMSLTSIFFRIGLLKRTTQLATASIIIAFGFTACGDEEEEKAEPVAEIKNEEIIEDTSKSGIKNFIGQEIYKKWTATKAQYTSPTHGTVVVYFNELLEKSFTDGNAIHTEDSVAVKEILDSSGKAIGHAAGIKITTGSDANSWLWYELLDSGTDIYGIGHTSCEGCHKDKEKSDYIDSKPD